MANQTISFVIPGIPIETISEPEIAGLLNVRAASSHAIVPARRGEARAAARVDTAPDSIVKIEYECGITEYLRADQLAAEVGASRGGNEIVIPASLYRGGATRGVTDWALKALHVFGVSPADAIARETALAVVEHFDGRLKTGLYRLNGDGSFGEQITGAQQLDTKAPYLVFIHGTASSTEGSFSGFWRDAQNQPTQEWKDLVSKYPNRILALEHCTFSVSPARNTLDLAALLPAQAAVHVITHSRGGLVGELLCLGPLSEDDLAAFEGRPDHDLLRNLAATLAQKQFTVAKFVRTACPAAGTILASKRLDTYLNIILNVIGHIPGLSANPFYALFKAAALELIKLRADPSLIPGIEAQMPESPLIHLLNTRGLQSKADLGVIAGDFEGSGFWGSLKEYALRAYYWEDNDFVVNTRSMSGGMARTRGVYQFLDQGDTVNHFSYFKNQRSRSRILEWLGAPFDVTPPDFQRVRGLAARGGARGAETLPIAILIPDAFGTQLNAADGSGIWLDYDALGGGRFLELADGGGAAGKVLGLYDDLYTRLLANYDTALLPYDWRKPVAESAAGLSALIADKRKQSGRPVHLIGHGMGGLVALEFARANGPVWTDLCKANSKMLLLGAPFRGSWHIARLLAGQASLARMLALLGRHSQAQVTATLQGFAGLLDMLPEEMFDASRWDGLPGRPNLALLANSRKWRVEFAAAALDPDRIAAVAGSAGATPSGMTEYTTEGDGQVTYAAGMPARVKTWYSPAAAHGELPSQAGPILDLLTRGATSALDSTPTARPAIADPRQLLAKEQAVFFPGETDLLDAALGGAAKPIETAEAALRISVAHGHLREAAHPVAVGHYADDGIVSAEKQLDIQLKGRLSDRFHMDIYPGSEGTSDVVRVPGAHPPGALIAGLGDVGDITAAKVRKGMLEACLRYALAMAEEKPPVGRKWQSAAVSSVLIGVSGGRAISVSESVAAIVQAAIEANRVLRKRNLWDKVRIDEVQFIELLEDTAIEAAHAAAALPERLRSNLEPRERIEFDNQLRTLPGGLWNRPPDGYAGGWWRRIQIGGEELELPETRERAAAPRQLTRLTFLSLTDRARAEETAVDTQDPLMKEMLLQSTTRPDYDPESATALFELLVPNPVKEQVRGANLVLVVDETSANYPWELLAERTRHRTTPLAVDTGMIRQFRTRNFRPGPRGAHQPTAFVAGDSRSKLPELPGAQAEARAVGSLLAAAGYQLAGPLIREAPSTVARRLMAGEYRILHLAGHGIYTPGRPEKTGMVLSDNVYLTSVIFGQIRNLPELVFLNCCHLAQIDAPRLRAEDPNALAASVAQTLIGMGVKAVVAAGWAVDDTAAVVFAETFYRRMLEGGRFGNAVIAARQAAYAAGNNNTWGAYQCYGNPDFALTPRPASTARAAFHFYSKREYMNELRNISASAKGASSQEAEELRGRATELDRACPSTMRDGELLFALGEAYKALKDFPSAIDAYRNAIAVPRASAPIEALEQLANVLDRGARNEEAAKASQLWAEAEKLLSILNAAIGPSGERLSLLGAISKRRGEKEQDKEKRGGHYRRAAELYREAYTFRRAKENLIDTYSGINWLMLEYSLGNPYEPLREAAEEILAYARLPKNSPDFWARVALPDALTVEYLFAGTLGEHVDEVVREYESAFQHAAGNEQDSALAQLDVMQKSAPSDALEAVIGRLNG
ncbi:MAG: CHAT domain-containing protein [Bryobacterales bacterium]|nr:CHAT domain-containing protein [Bryobacterales bacterium]